MLTRVDLTAENAKTLKLALEQEGDGQIMTENTVNLAALMGFLGTRFLSVPRLDAHGKVKGDGWVDDFALMKGRDGFVVLQQRAQSGDEKFKGPHTVAAYVVLHSNLDFAKEDRREGWPLRVRALLLDIVSWTLENGKPLMDTSDKFPGRPLWEALYSPEQNARMLEPDSEKLRSVLSGDQTVHSLWSEWALNEKDAHADFESCLRLIGVENNLKEMARRPGLI